MQNNVVHKDWQQIVEQSKRRKRDKEETDKEEGKKRERINLNAERRGPPGLVANR